MAPERDGGPRLVSLSDEYTSRIEDCVVALHALLDRYADGEPYDDQLRRLREFETICDVTNRDVCRTLAAARGDGADAAVVRGGHRAGDVIGLYHGLDDVANGAERVGEELAAVDPALPARRAEGLREMAALAVDATGLLATVVDDYVRALCLRDRHVSVTEPVERVRGLESQCDELRDHVISRAFDDAPDVAALVCYRLATETDAVVDAVEDVTDRLVCLGADRSWVDVPETAPPEAR